jgi:hypothetical protein
MDGFFVGFEGWKNTALHIKWTVDLQKLPVVGERAREKEEGEKL